MAPTTTYSSKHNNKQSSSSSRDKSSKSHGASRANTEQWMEHQSVEGPWDGVDGVYGYEYTSSGGAHRGSAYDDASMAATQGSTKHKTHKHGSHKSSSKK